MSEKTAINICVDSELLTQAGVIFNKFGMDMNAAFESLLRQAIKNPLDTVKPVDITEITGTPEFEGSESPLTIALGKTTEGEPFVFDLARAPHLLVGGETGSGKSMTLNTIIMSLLFKNNPEDLRLILIDTNSAGFDDYKHNPYLLAPVIKDEKKACQALEWSVQEMERRFELMKAIGVRNIRELNEKLETSPIMDPSSTEEDPRTLKKPPYIVVIIDEFADLILTNRRLTEILIMKLTQKGRAAGIHLVIATQYPSVNILNPMIKTSCPTRIALKVTSPYVSTSIINERGAEELLGNGDMFFMSPGRPLQRVQGAFVDPGYISGLSAFLSLQFDTKYIDLTVKDEKKDSEPVDTDVFYDKAVQIVVTERKASISYLQRKLGIEYERAAKLVEKMEAAGIVSEPTASGRRRILVSRTDIEDSQN